MHSSVPAETAPNDDLNGYQVQTPVCGRCGWLLIDITRTKRFVYRAPSLHQRYRDWSGTTKLVITRKALKKDSLKQLSITFSGDYANRHQPVLYI